MYNIHGYLTELQRCFNAKATLKLEINRVSTIAVVNVGIRHLPELES